MTIAEVLAGFEPAATAAKRCGVARQWVWLEIKRGNIPAAIWWGNGDMWLVPTSLVIHRRPRGRKIGYRK
jgi:hypothetical protein